MAYVTFTSPLEHALGSRSYRIVFALIALRAMACENTTLTVSCYEQDVIRIINAHYGRLDNNTCDASIGAADTECLVNGTRDVVYARSVND